MNATTASEPRPMTAMGRVGSAARSIAGWYLKSWLFLLWSAACVCIGAAWAFVAIAAVFKAKGLL